MDSGTRNQVSPRSHSPAISVRSMGAESVLKAPLVVVWLSAPTMSMPGRA